MPRNQPETAGGQQDRGRGGRFAPGTSGNPNGRPKGSRHKVTRAVEALLEGEAEAVTRKVIERALDGDTAAQKLILERIAPPKKDAPVTFDMPALDGAEALVNASRAVLEGVASGQLSPAEGKTIADLIETHARVVELNDFEVRLQRLEKGR